MSDARWKAFERRLARSLGTRRIPAAGERAGADFETGRFAYQAKKGRRFPSYLARWRHEIRETGARSGKIGAVLWQERNAPDSEPAVVLRFADWIELHGGDEPPVSPIARNASATLPPARSVLAQAVDGLCLGELSLLSPATCDTGFSYSAIQKMVSDGTISNVGKKGAPRVRRGDLPKKPGSKEPSKEEPDLVGMALAGKGLPGDFS